MDNTNTHQNPEVHENKELIKGVDYTVTEFETGFIIRPLTEKGRASHEKTRNAINEWFEKESKGSTWSHLL